MKKTLILLIISLKALAQSSTIAPNYVVIPGVATLPACSSTDKGRTVYNTTDNKMYFCNGSAWQSMAGVPSAGVGWSQTGNNISNTNAGNVGIGTSTPTGGLHIKKDNTGFLQENLSGTNKFEIKLNSGSGTTAQLRSLTGDIWLSAGKLLPDFRIESVTGNTTIGNTFFPNPEKLNVSGKILADQDIKTNEGIYSAKTGGLNMVPLGIFKVAYELDDDGILSNVNLINIAGNVLIGTYTYSSYQNQDDGHTMTLAINPNAIPVEYTRIYIGGTPIMNNRYSFANIKAYFYYEPSTNYNQNNDSRTAFINNGFSIEVQVDAFLQTFVAGTFMVYGIK